MTCSKFLLLAIGWMLLKVQDISAIPRGHAVGGRITDAEDVLHNRTFPTTEPVQRIQCPVAIVGAAYGGVYFAHRLVESGKVPARNICFFEAESRVGGRVYTVRNLPSKIPGAPHLLTVDVGGYRYVPTQKLIRGLIEDSLKLHTACYYPITCNDTRRIVTDRTRLNNLGYAYPIAFILDDLARRGMQIFYGHRLQGLFESKKGSALHLNFENNGSALSENVLLNIPSEAVSRLDIRGFPGAYADRIGTAVMQLPRTQLSTKVYAQYDDAWWVTKLNLTEGDFADRSKLPVLAGRYHDGSVACFRGNQRLHLRDAARADRCTGLLLAAYFGSSDLIGWRNYAGYQTDPTGDPLTIIPDGVGHPAQELLSAVHNRLLEYHQEALLEKGFKDYNKTIARPTHLYMGTWRNNHPLTSTIHEWPAFLSGMNLSSATQATLRPAPNLRVFLANEAFGTSPGWAEGSLIMAERVLSKHFGLGPPAWLNQDTEYYRHVVLNYSSFDDLTVQLFGHPLPLGSPKYT